MSTEQHIEAIRAAIAAHWGMAISEIALEERYVHVIEGYFPDGPSWFGDVAWVVHGEVCFQTILRRAPGEEWRVYLSIDDTSNFVPVCMGKLPRAGAGS